MRYDIAIIGNGPAGLSGAINAKIRNKNIIVFGNNSISNKVFKAKSVENYLGFANISGKGLANNFENHIKSMEINIINKKVNSVYDMGEYFSIVLNDSIYESKTVVIASGIEYTKPIKGEEFFLGKGVSYCATCDGALYKGKNIVVIGYNYESVEEANFLSQLASKVYYIPMQDDISAINSNIEILKDIPYEIKGDDLANTLILKNNELTIDGIFIIRDSISPYQLIPGIEIENNHIKVDLNMKTNIKGCFAAGDCVGKPYQYIKAAGQGQIAVYSAIAYIENQKQSGT